MKLHHTRGIVLRAVKYGETSIVVTMLTELFGIQSYLVNSVRTETKKGGNKAGMFQPAAILDLVVYHNELKPLNRVREFKWAHLYQNIFSDIIKNGIALFMVELLIKCLKQPESNPELYYFCEDAFLHLDKLGKAATANFPLFFALNATSFFGVPPGHLSPKLSAGAGYYFDLKEGEFAAERPSHPHFLEPGMARITSELLNVRQPAELEQIRLNHEMRRQLLEAFEIYYALHFQDFGKMRTLPVLREILN